MSSTFINAHVPLYIIGSARIALNEYSAETHTLLISVIDDDGLTYNHTIQFRGATQPGTFGYIVMLGLYSTRIMSIYLPLMIVHILYMMRFYIYI